MADRSITIKRDDPLKKSFARKAAGSLAQRVLLMSIVLLGLPLLIHTFFLYHREYQENVDDAFLTMRSLAEGRAQDLEQMIQNQLIILRAISDDLPEDQEKKEFFAHEAKEYQIHRLFYVESDRCKESFCSEPSLFSEKPFVWINAGKKRLYVGKTIERPNRPIGSLIIATPAKQFLNRLTYQEYSPYPLRLSILDESGAVILSSDNDHPAPYLAEAQKQPNTWLLKSRMGQFLAVKIPIQKTNYTLMLDTPEKSIAQLQLKDYFYRIASLIFLVCIVGGALLYWLTHLLSQPLRSLCSIMKRISEGATHVRYTESKMGFEINILGRQMNQMLDAMLEHQKEAERERLIRERLAQELKIGHQIQASMLPTDLPEIPALEIAPGFLAAREVSGDFYDLFVMKDGRLLIAMADAADKGISACLYSLSFRSMLRSAATALNDLSPIVRMANEILMRDTAHSSFFITAWIGIYDPASKKLTFCSQGHPPAFIRKSNGQIVELAAKGMALGVEEIKPVIQEIVLHPQDLLLLYTDGVIEAVDTDRQFFGSSRLKEFLSRCKKNHPQGIVDQLLDEVHLFCAGTPQADDLTLLAIKIKN